MRDATPPSPPGPPTTGTRRRVVTATLAVGVPMGQQHYEVNLVAALREVAGPAWDVVAHRVRSLRSGDAGDSRLPLRLVGRLPLPLQRAVGRATYGHADLLHRQDLRVPPSTGPEVLTIHDLAPLHFPDEGALPDRWRESVRAASSVVTVSGAVADEIAEACGVPRPEVIPNGFDPELLAVPALTPGELAALGIGGRFVVHLGGATARKNLDGLADAWRAVSAAEPDLALVLCGPDHPRRRALFGDLERCVLTGRLPRRTVIGLLRAAAVLVVPSRYEGFGLPALEGMVVGTPVVAARCSSLPEVCGDGAVLVEPDGEGIAGGIAAALSDPGVPAMVEAARRRALACTWERAARAHLDLYGRLAG